MINNLQPRETLMKRLFTAAAFVVLATYMSTTNAITVSAAIDLYDDPLNALGLSGVSLGQTAEVSFSINNLIPDDTFFPSNSAGYAFTSNPLVDAPGVITINGTTLGAPTGNRIEVGIQNTPGLDFYSYRQVFASPTPQFIQINWGVAFLDSTGSAVSDVDLFNINSTAGWETFVIFAAGIDLNTVGDPSVLLLRATGSASAVPLPAGVWLFGSAIVGLIGFRAKRD